MCLPVRHLCLVLSHIRKPFACVWKRFLQTVCPLQKTCARFINVLPMNGLQIPFPDNHSSLLSNLFTFYF